MTGCTAVAGTHEFVVPSLAEALAGYGSALHPVAGRAVDGVLSGASGVG